MTGNWNGGVCEMNPSNKSNPFPGMNPYLEAKIISAGFHHGLICRLRTQLNKVLPMHYIANSVKRLLL